MSYLYAINFAPGFEEIVADVLNGLKAEIVFSEEAFFIVKFKREVQADELGFAKSLVQIFDYKDNPDALSLLLPSGLKFDPSAKTFTIRNFESGRPSKFDSEKKSELIREISIKTGLQYSSFEPDVDFVVAKRRDGLGYFGVKRDSKSATKVNKGELNRDVANLLIRLGGVELGMDVLDAFAGYGSITRELLRSFSPNSVVVVEKESSLINSLKVIFKDKKEVSVIAADVLNHLRKTDKRFDLIVADPPWGEFKDFNGDLTKLYSYFLAGAKTKLKPNGRVVILSSNKDALMGAAEESGLSVLDRLNVLISGKKVLVLKLV